VQIYLYFANEPLGSNTYTTSGDLKLYHFWIDRGTQFGIWPILNESSVYPPYAFIPMLLAGIFTYQNLFLFKLIWYILMIILWGLGTHFLWKQVDKRSVSKISNNLTDICRLGYGGCYFIPLFMLALGPVFTSRIDCVAGALGLFGFISLQKNKSIAAAWFVVSAWIKVFVGANFTPLLFVARRHLIKVIIPAFIVTLGVVVIIPFCQSPTNVISFLTYQSDRHLQIESIAATPAMILELFTGTHDIMYNNSISTNEIVSPICNLISSVLNYLLIVAVGLVLYLIWQAKKVAETQLVLYGGLGIILALIVFNKVGSPQYFTALLPTLAYALSLPNFTKWLKICLLSGFIAIFTQLVYPLSYDWLINYDNWHILGVLILTLRNILVVWLFIEVIISLYKLPRQKTV
jgi:hypothetical protein